MIEQMDNILTIKKMMELRRLISGMGSLILLQVEVGQELRIYKK